MNQPQYSHCPRKILSREETIVTPWRKISDEQSIPLDKHYLTLCGSLTNDNGCTIPMCEPLHLWNSGLIQTEQFFGIERNSIIHQANLAAIERDFPPSERPHLIGDNLTNVLYPGIKNHLFDPAIVNLDTILGPRRALHLLTETIAAMSTVQGLSMVVWNVILEATCKCRKDRRPELQTTLQDTHLRGLLDDNSWRQYRWPQGYLYEYGGTGKTSHTTMGTTVFWRKGK